MTRKQSPCSSRDASPYNSRRKVPRLKVTQRNSQSSKQNSHHTRKTNRARRAGATVISVPAQHTKHHTLHTLHTKQRFTEIEGRQIERACSAARRACASAVRGSRTRTSRSVFSRCLLLSVRHRRFASILSLYNRGHLRIPFSFPEILTMFRGFTFAYL